ncbi:hypothetical protein B0O99DRAFT_682622 [Bisporella sp. PMI_857]|nr:hypothetical protein B0O99DRAFT_682622 [Bisporella sp. PMI_857]
MPSRRPHTKSRHGCMECKAKKIKCDETKPVCLKCSKRSNDCHYQDTISTNTNSCSTTTRSLSNGPKPTDIDIGSFFDLFRSATIYTGPPGSPSDGQWPQYDAFYDLKLLHHYMTCTYLTLAKDSSLEHTWQVIMPQIAYSHPFLMHGLLAISACHFAVLEPERAEHYTGLATRHYASAVEIFRPMLENIQEANAMPVLAFSTLIACLQFTMPHTSLSQPTVPTPNKYISDQLDMFRLVRGIKGVLDTAWTWAENSPLSLLFIGTAMEDPEEPLPYNAEVVVQALEKHIQINAETEELKNGYLDAMHQFRKCYPRGTPGNRCQTLVFAWPFLLSNNFFLAMLAGRPIALIILGYFGTLLHMLKSRWWVGNRGQQLLLRQIETCYI